MATKTLTSVVPAAVPEFLEAGCVSMKEAMRLTSLGRIHLYRLMSQGRLTYCKLGNRRLIVKSSLMAILAESLVAGS